jgi:hypothetical protein
MIGVNSMNLSNWGVDGKQNFTQKGVKHRKEADIRLL